MLRKITTVFLLLAFMFAAVFSYAEANPVEPYSRSGVLGVDKVTVNPGGIIDVSGSGFNPNVNVTVLWDGTNAITVKSDGSGNISFVFTTASNASSGTHILSAVGASTKVEGSKNYNETLTLARNINVNTKKTNNTRYTYIYKTIKVQGAHGLVTKTIKVKRLIRHHHKRHHHRKSKR